MRIDLNAKTTNLPETEGGPKAAAARAPAQDPLGEDAATLVGGARLHQLEKLISQLPEERADKIEALTRALRSGQYQVDPEQVAQALVTEMSGSSVLRR